MIKMEQFVRFFPVAGGDISGSHMSNPSIFTAELYAAMESMNNILRKV